MLGPAVLLALAGAWLASIVPQRYRGETLVQVEAVGADSGAGRDLFSATRREAALRRDLLADERLGRLVREIGPAWRPRGGTTGDRTTTVSQGLEVTSRDRGVFAIRFEDPDPGMAVLVPNILTADLIEDVDRQRPRVSTEELAEAEARVRATREEVEAKETTVRRLLDRRSTRPAPSSAARGRLRAERESVSSALSAAEERELDLLKAIDTQRQSAAEVDTGLSSELERLRAELAELRERYTELHPDVQAKMRRLRDLESQIPSPEETEPAALSRLQEELEEVEAEIRAKREDLARLDAELAAPQPRPAPAVEARAGDLDDAQRELEQARKAHMAALREWEEAQAPDPLTEAGAVRYVLLDPAQTPRPTRPGPLSLGLLGWVLGMGIGVAAAVLLDSRDDTVRTPAEAEELLGKPLLVSIPDMGRRSVLGFSRRKR